MNELVERAARAIMWSTWPTARTAEIEFASLTERGRSVLRAQARAVIAAMREPTKEMVQEGGTVLDYCLDSDFSSLPDGGCDYYTTVRSGTQTEVWQAMIDAGLKDG